MLPTPIGRPGPAISEGRSADPEHSVKWAIWRISADLVRWTEESCVALGSSAWSRRLATHNSVRSGLRIR